MAVKFTSFLAKLVKNNQDKLDGIDADKLADQVAVILENKIKAPWLFRIFGGTIRKFIAEVIDALIDEIQESAEKA